MRRIKGFVVAGLALLALMPSAVRAELKGERGDRLPDRRQGVHRLSRLRRCRRRQTPGRAGGARGVGAE